MRRVGILSLWLSLAVLATFTIPRSGSAVGRTAPILVIAHKSVTVTALSRDELRVIFQTTIRTWPDGTSIKPFNLPNNNPVRRAFDSAVLGLEPDLVGRYWIDRRIRGGDRPPGTVPSAALMVRLVAQLPGAIGYAEAGDVDSSVKLVGKLVDGQVVAP